MIRFLAISALLVLAIAANAALYLRPQESPRAMPGTTRAMIGNAIFEVPRAYVRNAGHWAGGRLERLDLALIFETLEPLPPVSLDAPETALPDRLTVALSPMRTGADGAERFQQLYSRFIRAETTNQPNGLVTRQFRKATPYEDQDIHIGAGGSRLFYAICPLPSRGTVEPCQAHFVAEGVAVELRFPRARLGEWRMLQGRMGALLKSWHRPARAGQPG